VAVAKCTCKYSPAVGTGINPVRHKLCTASATSSAGAHVGPPMSPVRAVYISNRPDQCIEDCNVNAIVETLILNLHVPLDHAPK
jgi:hypothetical protein